MDLKEKAREISASVKERIQSNQRENAKRKAEYDKAYQEALTAALAKKHAKEKVVRLDQARINALQDAKTLGKARRKTSEMIQFSRKARAFLAHRKQRMLLAERNIIGIEKRNRSYGTGLFSGGQGFKLGIGGGKSFGGNTNNARKRKNLLRI